MSEADFAIFPCLFVINRSLLLQLWKVFDLQIIISDTGFSSKWVETLSILNTSPATPVNYEAITEINTTID